jgi:hypothetical protein
MVKHEALSSNPRPTPRKNALVQEGKKGKEEGR